MEWYGYVGLGIFIYILIYIIVRTVVSLRIKQTKDPYRSEYYGR